MGTLTMIDWLMIVCVCVCVWGGGGGGGVGGMSYFQPWLASQIKSLQNDQ